VPIQAIVSASPCLGFAGEPAEEPLRGWHRDLHGPEGWRAWWIVPTSRRRRAVARTASAATRLPRVLTLDGLVQYLLGFSLVRARPLGNAGRLLRIARACRDVDPRNAPTVGRVFQIDRLASLWRASHASAPTGRGLGAILARYEDILRSEGVLDEPALLRALANDLSDSTGPLARQVAGRRIYFDGFERFTEAESTLLDALARSADVRLWLVGAPGHPNRPDAATVLERLRVPHPHDDRRDPASPEQIDLFTAPTPERECRDVAAHVKAFVRTTGARLSDVAIVIPDDSYLPPLADAFASAGVLLTPSAEAFALIDSRPARTLLAILRLVRHGWPADALFDFLRQPLVRNRLRNAGCLDQLERMSAVRAERNDAGSWLRRWRDAADDDRVSDLVNSIEPILTPLRVLDLARDGVAPDQFPPLVELLARWLDQIGLPARLSPESVPDWTIVPPREWEIDQLAFNNLRDVFEELRGLPVDDLPLRPDRRVDVEGVLKLALTAETFQTGSHDDAGVQVLRARAVRGSRFRAIYAVGLNEGAAPVDPGRATDDDELADPKRTWRDELLREQHGHFEQLFASAERLVLSRPERRDGAPTRESPYLRATRLRLGRNAEPFPARPIADFREALVDAPAELAAHLEARRLWQARQADDALRIEGWAMPLLQLCYPPDRAYGATALEEYAACPFRHFVKHTLRLAELGGEETALRWGNLFHDAIDRAFKADDARPIDERFRDQLRAALDAADPPLDSTYRHDYEQALFKAFSIVDRFLADNGFEQVESEWVQADAEIPDGAGGTIRLNVRIDRIDRRKDGVELICDFKTGTMPGKKQLLNRTETGRALQLPLYGLVRQTLTGQPVRHGLYVHLNRRIKGDADSPTSFLVQLAEIAPTKDRTKLPFEPELAGATAARLVNDLRAGQIPLTRFDVDDSDPACNAYCPVRHACRHPKGY
jgi:RecB family exonuclease